MSSRSRTVRLFDDRWVVAATIGVMFVAVFALRNATYTTNDGIGLLYSVPIALAAIRFGPWIGSACALTAFGLFVWYVNHNPQHVVTLDGYASRFGTYICIGAMLGYIALARERAQARERERTRSRFLDLQRMRDQERRAISSDLHDFVLQPVMVSLMRLEEVRDVLAESGATALDASEELQRNALGSLRSVMDGLQPLDLDHVDLGGALRGLSEELSTAYGVSTSCTAGEDLPDLDPVVKLLTYRVIAEAARNAAKHGEGAPIQVIVRSVAQSIVAQIEDEGPGFAEAVKITDREVPGIGIGFGALLEQLLEAGGTYTVTSTPGQGTKIRFRVPLSATPPS